MSDIREVLKCFSLKDGFRSILQWLYRPPFRGGWTKKLQTFSRYFFWEWPSKYCIPSLLLFSWACFYVDLDDIQWNERATSTARNFNNSRPSYLKFSNMINLCTNIWFVENSKCQQFLFWKRKIFQFFKKTTITHFSCFKGSLFCSRWMVLLKWMLTSFERLLLAF